MGLQAHEVYAHAMLEYCQTHPHWQQLQTPGQVFEFLQTTVWKPSTPQSSWVQGGRFRLACSQDGRRVSIGWG